MARELTPDGSRSLEGDVLFGDRELLVVDGYNVIHKSGRKPKATRNKLS